MNFPSALAKAANTNSEPSSETTSANPRSSMTKPLRLLLVEDSGDDAELVIRELRRAGFHPIWTPVATQEDFKAALQEGPWDIVISDHSLPKYSGMAALADLRATGKYIPFILISGSIGEAVAVTAMKAGAQDYVLKGDLTRLPAAVEREVREAAARVEQTRMRQQLMISERMASCGMLAAGVAHEINNPLSVAISNLEFTVENMTTILAEARSSESGDRRDSGMDAMWGRIADLGDSLGDAREALARIRNIVRDVKVFSRAHDEITEPVDVRTALDSSSRMAWNEIRHRATLIKDYGHVPLVNANPSRLGQLLLNLIVNAAQAIPEGNATRNEIRLTTRTADDGRAIIEVRDTGSGISKENMERIFDPFFTTKPIGEGTGLGLSICHRIATELGGRIDVESEPNKGALFRVVLPPARGGRPERLVSSPPSRHGGRVLVIDDEPAICRALQRSLAHHHDVVAMTSAKEALSQIAEGRRFDVILTDLMMPDVTGMDMYEHLCRIAPDQAERMIFLTGGAFTMRAREFLDAVPNQRIEKPFEAAQVLAVIAGLAK